MRRFLLVLRDFSLDGLLGIVFRMIADNANSRVICNVIVCYFSLISRTFALQSCPFADYFQKFLWLLRHNLNYGHRSGVILKRIGLIGSVIVLKACFLKFSCSKFQKQVDAVAIFIIINYPFCEVQI